MDFNEIISHNLSLPAAQIAADVNKALEKHSSVVVTAPPGAGKSTLLRTIAGFLLPLEGTVLLGGDDVRALSPRQRAERMAVVLTDRPDVMCTTVWQMAMLKGM